MGGYVTDEELELRLEDEKGDGKVANAAAHPDSSSSKTPEAPKQQQQQLQAPPKPPRSEDLQSPSKEVLIADDSSRRYFTP